MEIMAPQRRARTRSQIGSDQNINPTAPVRKRKAENSPLKNEKVKRSALGNLTNKANNTNTEEEKKILTTDVDIKKTVTAISKESEHFIAPVLPTISNGAPKILTRAAARNASKNNVTKKPQSTNSTSKSADIPVNINPIASVVNDSDLKKPVVPRTSVEAQKEVFCPPEATDTVVTTLAKNKVLTETQKPTMRRISNEFEQTEETLYISALDDISSSDASQLSDLSGSLGESARNSLSHEDVEKSSLSKDTVHNKKPNRKVPNGVVDFDRICESNPDMVADYAMDIFEYMKSREKCFFIEDYIEKQKYISQWMRALLVDWMVEVQETFELNHEALYLAVKLVDIFLGQEIIFRDKLQLLGGAALLISCKFDERIPPLLEDFMLICDGAYTKSELLQMEKSVLKTIGYDLGIPLSYSFLRRYARCAGVSMVILTLARFILEYSLMDYKTIRLSDSKIACAALFMAMRLKGMDNPWTVTLKYYTGYELKDFAYIVSVLNMGLHRKPLDTIKTIRSKYSHKIFFEVAKTPRMCNRGLFATTDINYATIANDSNIIL